MTQDAHGVRAEWERLLGWLAREAPAVAAQVRPPTNLPISAELIDGSGGDWPSELMEWFSLHDGVFEGPQSHFLGIYMPIGAAQALNSWKSQLSAAASTWSEQDRADVADSSSGEDRFVFDPRLVPIAEDGGGGSLVVDLRPGPARGHVVGFDPEAGSDYHAGSDASISALLRRALNTLESPAGRGFVSGDDRLAFVSAFSSGWAEGNPGWPVPSSELVLPAPRASRVPSWSWARISDAVSDTTWGEDAQAMAIIGPAFDYLLTLDDELAAATAEPPYEIGHVGLDSILAACVDHAFNVRGAQPPTWTSNRNRSMSDLWAVLDFPSAELRKLRATPPAFHAHGIGFTWSRA